MIFNTNPYTLEKSKAYSFLTDSELNKALNNSKAAYKTWKNSLLTTRIELCENLVATMRSQKDLLAHNITTEMGKPIQESYNEIEKCIGLVNYYKDNLLQFLESKKINTNTSIYYTPTGVVFGIMPWNFPLWQVFRFAIPAILGGNVCVLKHAPNVFECGNLIEKLFVKAGFPKKVFNNLIIDIPQVETVIKHSQGICVTGSTKAGASVASLAGKHLKKSVLELGGTDAYVLLKDADINMALQKAFKARCLNAGQVCIAPKRIYIPKKHLSKATETLTENIAKIVLGNPLDTKTTMGPLSKTEFLTIVHKQVKTAIKHGATLIVGGNIKAPFYEPTLLICNDNNPILDEEIFGP
ncbi:aldehyde dehydrogenase family protein, partial [Flavobacteriaceae bacterium]|nr:aldehyde dehydrogenase family protein [Flavobacteriaceae bacterium]